MVAFSKYYDSSIKESIDTVELHNLVVRIRSMTANEVVAYSNDLQTECRIDPSYENTKEFKVAAKAVMRRIQECRNNGERPGRRPSIIECIEAVIHGVIVGDEFSKRLR